MSRAKTLVSSLSLVAVLLTPVTAAYANPLNTAPGRLHAAQPSAYTDPVPVEGSPSKTQPDYAFEENGTRVEVYTSAGGVDVPQDWRSVDAFSYLVASVPAAKHSYATIFNTLHDGDRAVRQGTGWKINTSNPNRTPFTPTAAYTHLLNKYTTDAERKKYVHILADKRNVNTALKTGSGLASLITQATDYSTCNRTSTGACLTNESGAIMHSKYAAFEQAKDSTGTLRDNVVWVTSANLNGSSGGKKSNTSIAVYGDQKAYTDMVRLFEAQRKQSISGITNMLEKGFDTDNTNIRLYPSPRRGTKTDHEAAYLDGIADTVKTDCQAWVVHSLFSRNSIRDGLVELKSDGCDVKIVLGFRALADVATHYFKVGAEMRELIDHVEFADVHDKSMAVSYKENGTPKGLAFGGSANLNTTSLTHDELAFSVDNAEMAQAMGRHGERLYLLAKGTEKVKPVTGVTVTPGSTDVDTPKIVKGETLKLRANLAPTNASVRTVTWSSSNATVATVDTDGVVTAHGPGFADITVLTVSGGKEDTVTVEVTEDGTTTPADNSAKPILSVTNPPELTMGTYQTFGGTTTAVVTWSQGDVNLNGKVQLQYSSKGKWKNYRMIDIVDGRGVGVYTVKAGKGWRVVARTRDFPVPNDPNARLSKASLVSDMVIPTVSQSARTTTTPRLYGPTLVTARKNVPYRLSWHNNTGRNQTARVQYYTGKKWSTAGTIVVPKGVKVLDFAWPAVKSRKWRVSVGGKNTKSHMVYTQK